MKAFEVEEIEELGAGLEKVVVGEILEIQKHPNADKLQLVRVDIKKEKLDVVCGATNIQVGQKVPVALVGAKLPGGEIKEVEIRGVKSFGMLCAEDELGLGKDHGGILILDPETPKGELVAEALWLRDSLLEIKVLPDRAHDALSHFGLAREIAALEGRKMADQSYQKLKLPKLRPGNLKIEIKDKQGCSRYSGVLVKEVLIKESPLREKMLLRKFGINAINNVVDATNLVLLELGQPMHAFDYDKLTLPVVIRRAEKKEIIKLLDGNIYSLEESDVVIADAKGPIALAGIMGGMDSAVTEGTKNILLEAANFNPVNIRETRIRLNVRTDASDRFEKEIDPNLAEKGMARALAIIQKAGGKIESGRDVYPKKIKNWTIGLDLQYVAGLLGEAIPEAKVKRNLELLGLKVGKKGKKFLVTIPTERLDLKTPEDLIEEIGRMFGYENIKSEVPLVPVQIAEAKKGLIFERQVKEILAGSGFSEVYNYSFYGQREAELAQVGAIEHWELQNPMNPEQALVRLSLIPNILKNVKDNLKYYSSFKIFESGAVFFKKDSSLPEEKKMLVVAVVLPDSAEKKTEVFLEAKGMVNYLLEKIGITDYYYDNFDAVPDDSLLTLWHEGRTAQIRLEGTEKPLGYVGEINPLILADFDIHKRVAIFEFSLERIEKASAEEREYKPLRKYPTVERDISLLASTSIRVDDVLENIQKYGGDLVLDVDLFDIFDFPEENKTSLAFHLIFGADERTLTSEEVERIMEKIVLGLEKDLKVKVRK